MKDNDLTGLLDGMAQEFLFRDSKDLDIPTAGKLLNHLEKIIEEAQKKKISPIKNCAGSLSNVLEKIILNAVKDKEKAAKLFESGIYLMQEIADSYKNTGKYKGNIKKFLEKTVALTKIVVSETNVPKAVLPKKIASSSAGSPDETPDNKISSGTEETIQIQDESLTRDFIAEGLEYIGEIEVNILNLENEPENKDYINAIFRPFHSIKGVASFLNLEKIRALAHNLESLLDKARNGEIAVTPSLIDVVLDGADALKALIGQLKDVLERKKAEPEYAVPTLLLLSVGWKNSRTKRVVSVGFNNPSHLFPVRE